MSDYMFKKYKVLAASLMMLTGQSLASSTFPNITENFTATNVPTIFKGDWLLNTPTLSGSTQSLKSAKITHNGVSKNEAIVDFKNDGNFSFDYAVRAEEGYDFLHFYLDGKLQLKETGGRKWHTANFPITQGKHTLTWEYHKDGSVSRYEDAAWIDNLTFKGIKSSKATNVLFLTSRLASSSNSFTKEIITSQFNRTKALIKQLSYGKHEVNLVGIKDMGALNFAKSDVIAWSGTSAVIARMLRDEGRSPFDKCDISIEAPRAQAYLDNMSKEIRDRWAITITTLDLRFIKKHLTETPCRDLNAGDIVSRGMPFPSDVDLSNVDVVLYSPFDDELHSGGYQTTLSYSGFALPKNISADKIQYILSGATNSEIAAYKPVVSYSDSGQSESADLSSVYLKDKDYLQTRYSHVNSHEMLHALGLGTHDNGLEYFTPENTVKKVNKNPNLEVNLGYGDWFSTLGKGTYSGGLAPSSREHLGWLAPERINNITAKESGKSFILMPLSRKEGVVAAKIHVPELKGFIYLSFESNENEYATLNKAELAKNASGIIVRFAKDEGAGKLATSVLLDPDNNTKNNDYALNAHEYFDIANITIFVDGVFGDKAHYRVFYN